MNVIKEVNKVVRAGGGLDVSELLLFHEGREERIRPLENEDLVDHAGDLGNGDGSVVAKGLR